MSMAPALDVLDRAVKGEAGALSLLERTASIYVLDAANPSLQRTYGCWDFINQALTEVERYEGMAQTQQNQIDLRGHVQLLALMSRRAARRSPEADRRLIATCLSNARKYDASNDEANNFIEKNTQTRERVMGRIAALVFDFSFHNKRLGGHNSGASAFSDHIAIENLCMIVAANAISSGPQETEQFVLEWIIPSAENLPPHAIAAIVFHLGSEASGKTVPVGTGDAIKKLSEPIFCHVIVPLLTQALGNSDLNEMNDNMIVGRCSTSQRLVALSLRALEQWCSVLNLEIVELKRICDKSSQGIIISLISDALYSDLEVILDASAELLESLLARGLRASNMVGVRQSVECAKTAEAAMDGEGKERDALLTELSCAIGLQRHRFTRVDHTGHTSSARCLVRVAAAVAVASKPLFASNEKHLLGGMLDLLLKAADHPSVHVCGISIEALSSLLNSGIDINDRLLPILQHRVAWPLNLINETALATTNECGASQIDNLDCEVDFHQFERFREHVLCDALIACYDNNRSRFVEICCSAVENICNGAVGLEDSFQLEAALFCLSSVAMKASKTAGLVTATPASRAAYGKATTHRRKNEKSEKSMLEECTIHDEYLARCVNALAKTTGYATTNPLALAQMCRFIGKYSSWLVKSPTQGVLDAGAEVALTSFNLAGGALSDDLSAKAIIQEMSISPYAEAATALRNILSRSPSHFTTPQALVALAGGWESSYTSANANRIINIEDREALCSGICRVLASTPPGEWVASLSSLARPTIECLETVVKKADAIGAALPGGNRPEPNITLQTVLKRGGDEIRLLSKMVLVFNHAIQDNSKTLKNSENNGVGVSSKFEHPFIDVLRRTWPCLSQLAQNYSSHCAISVTLGSLLTQSVSIKDAEKDKLSILRELCCMARIVMDSIVKGTETATLSPILEFVAEVVTLHGLAAENCVITKNGSSTNYCDEARHVIEELLLITAEAVGAVVGDAWSHPKEQKQGQSPFEGSPELRRIERNSPEALSGLFTILTACIKECPVLLITMEGGQRSSWEDETMFNQSVDAAALAVNDKEVDAARSAMIFLTSLLDLIARIQREQSTNARWQKILPVVESAIKKNYDNIVLRLIFGACGNCPHEVLDPAAALLHSLILWSPADCTQATVLNALRSNTFALGNGGRAITHNVLGRVKTGSVSPSALMDFLGEIWQMHQNDDMNASVDGEAIEKLKAIYFQS